MIDNFLDRSVWALIYAVILGAAIHTGDARERGAPEIQKDTSHSEWIRESFAQNRILNTLDKKHVFLIDFY